MENPGFDEIRAVLEASAKARRRAKLQRGLIRAKRLRRIPGHHRYLPKELAVQLARGRQDPTEGMRLRSDFLADLRKASEEHKAAVLRSTEAITDELKANVVAWRKKKELLASRGSRLLAPGLNFNFVVLDTPGLVLPFSGDVNEDALSTAPWDNVIRYNGEWNTAGKAINGGDSASFVFAWTNAADRAVVINAETFAIANGFYDVFIGGDDVGGFEIYFALNVLQWWQDPPTSPPFQFSQLAETFGVMLGPAGQLGDDQSGSFSGISDVRYNGLSVPAGGTVVFEASIGVSYGIASSGGIRLDVASGGFQEVCPALVLAIIG